MMSLCPIYGAWLINRTYLGDSPGEATSGQTVTSMIALSVCLCYLVMKEDLIRCGDILLP